MNNAELSVILTHLTLANLLLMRARGFTMRKAFIFPALILTAITIGPLFEQVAHASAQQAYRCVLDMDIKAPDSLAKGDIDGEYPGPLADLTLAANAISVHKTLSTIKSDNNNGAAAISELQLGMYRHDDEIQVVVETVIVGAQGLRKEIAHMGIDFKNGADPQFITHGFIPRDAGISQEVPMTRSRFLGLGEKIEMTTEQVTFSDAAFFDPLAGVDLQCALVTGKN
jgi:hypothetical protein